jgi:hypothetical protein
MRMRSTDDESGLAPMEMLVALTLVAIALLTIVSALVTGEGVVESGKAETTPVFLSAANLTANFAASFAAMRESAPGAAAWPAVVLPPAV